MKVERRAAKKAGMKAEWWVVMMGGKKVDWKDRLKVVLMV